MARTIESTRELDPVTSTTQESPPKSRKSPWQSEWLWLISALVITVFLYWKVFAWLSSVWASNPDYSHGYLVPVFAAYILWTKRGLLRTIQVGEEPAKGTAASDSSLLFGGALIGLGLLTRMSGIYTRVLTLEGISLIPFVLGVIMILFGRRVARWGAPAVCFLLFMIPLPNFLSGQLSGFLQNIATVVSTFAFQTLGIPAFAEGNVISLSNGQIGVAEACSGVRMLYAFFALTVGACMIIDRAWPEKVSIALSAVPIAIAANCMRIIATGIAFEFLDSKTAEYIFHDVAGWLMMPTGFVILLGVLGILDRLIVPDDSFPIRSRLR